VGRRPGNSETSTCPASAAHAYSPYIQSLESCASPRPGAIGKCIISKPIASRTYGCPTCHIWYHLTCARYSERPSLNVLRCHSIVGGKESLHDVPYPFLPRNVLILSVPGDNCFPDAGMMCFTGASAPPFSSPLCHLRAIGKVETHYFKLKRLL
jgi:hypothetical protein